MPDNRFTSGVISELETRVMFDGAGALVADNVVEASDVSSGEDASSLSAQEEAAFVEQQTLLASGGDAQDSSPRAVVIYDASVSDLDDVLASLGDDVQAFALPEGDDPLSAISDILADLEAIDSLHIVSHGDNAQVTLAGQVLTEESLLAAGDTLAQWQTALSPEADILLYGCDVAQGESGQGFINTLSTLTGADVAASTDLSGAANLGGDWDLEAQAGTVETSVLSAFQNYSYVLTTAMDGASSNFSEVLKGANFDPGQDIQAQAAIDLTGDASNAMLYMKYDDQGTSGSTADDELYIRIRTDQTLDNGDKYNGYTWMGMDVDSDGDLDAFLMAIGTSQGFSLNLYNAGTGANVSPSTTDLDSNSGVSQLVTNEAITVEETGSGNSAVFVKSYSTSHIIKKVADVDGGGGDVDSDSNPDYFLTFKLNADNFFTELNKKELTGSNGALISSMNSGAGVDKDTSLRFVVATAQNDNALNGDMGGINDGSADLTATYVSLGLFVDGSLGDPASMSSNATAPSVSAGDLSFTENDGATVIDGSATANDSDGDSDWDTNAKFEVQLTANSESTDVLAISTSGNFSISGANLSHSGTVIGTISETSGTSNDGTVTGSDKLTVNFNSNATNAIVQELTRSITFNNTSEDPSTTARTVTFTLTDKGGSAGTDTSTISVAKANDAPTASNNTVTTNEDTAKVFAASDFNFTDVDGDTLSKVQITTLESNGTLQYNNGTSWVDVTLNQEITKADIDAGNLRFVPASNANGTNYDSFGFKVSDGTTYSTSAYTMQIDVDAVNDAPTASNNTVTTNEDTAKVFSASDFNFTDVDGDALSKVQITTLESNGTLQYNNGTSWVDVTLNQEITKADIDAGNLRFVPASNANGTNYDSFGFKVSDGTTYSTSAYTMQIDVDAANDAPTASNNTVTTNEDTAKVFAASDFNFTDVDGDTLSKVQITTLESNGTLQYNNGTSWVDVTLNQEITKADIDAGNLRFVPASNANGTNYDSFGFKVSDGTTYSTSAYTMQIDVDAVNDAPTASNNTVTTNEDTAKVFAASDFNFTDVDGDTLSKVQITTLESNGTLQYNNGTSWVDVTLNQEITKADIDAGNLRFVPASNANGTNYDSFGFKVSDGTTYSTSAYTMQVDVDAVNDLPTGADKTVSTAINTNKVFASSDITFTDVESSDYTKIKITSLESAGTLQYNNGTSWVDVTLNQEITKADIDAGNLRFVPASNASGTNYDNFQFQVSDGTDYSSSSYTMTIDVTGSAAPSVSAGDLSFTENDGATAIDASATANDGDGDSDWDTNAKFEVQLTANSESTDVLAISTSGNFAISGSDLSYNNTVIGTISETSGTSNDGTVTGSDKLTVNFNSNATNAIVQELTRAITFNNTSENPDTTSRTVTLTLTDKNGASGSDTSTISVAKANDAPTASNNTVTTNEDTAKVFAASEFNFSDVDGDTLSKVQITTLESNGTLQYNNGTSWVDVTLNQEITKADIDAGKLRFVPASNANGTNYDSFGFKVSDGTTYSTSAYTMQVDVDAVNDAPTAADKTLTTAINESIVVKTSDLGYSDTEGSTMTKVKITTLESNGTLQYNNGTSWVDVTLNQEISKADIDANKLRFVPATNQSGNAYDSFKFQVHDGTEYSADSKTITFNVTPNNAPDITSNGGGSTATISVKENTTAVTTVTATDADNDTLTFSISGGEDSSKFSIDANTGALTFKNAPDYENPTDVGKNNSYIVEVTVADGNGGTTVQTITVNVTDVEEATTRTPPPSSPTPAPSPAPAPTSTPTSSPPTTVSSPVVTTPIAPPADPAPAPTPVIQPVISTAPTGTLVFSGAGTSQQTVQDIAISVSSTSTSVTTTSTSQSTSQATTQDGLGGNAPDGPGSENTAIQSFVVSAQDNSGAGKVSISVEEGLPAWMEIQTDGATGTLVMKGERPDGDTSTYQVKIKMKRLDGEEVDAIITIEPVVTEGDVSGTGEPQQGPQEPAAEADEQASLDWLGQLIASLDQPDAPSQSMGAENGEMDGFTEQLAAERQAYEGWQASLIQA